MSFSSIPISFKAFTISFILAVFSFTARAAVDLASVFTPTIRLAMSGLANTRPVADTENWLLKSSLRKASATETITIAVTQSRVKILNQNIGLWQQVALFALILSIFFPFNPTCFRLDFSL